MNRRQITLAALLCAVLAFPLFAQRADVVTISGSWKFQPGDSIAYKEPLFNDAGWTSLHVDSIWENQGYSSLDRFAWYRLRFTIPSAILETAPLKDSLLFFLGKINNFDQAYLNGSLLGNNGAVAQPGTAGGDTAFLKAETGLWNVERRYVVAAHDPRVFWDKENILAVRVFDQGGQGGMWSGGQIVRMTRPIDYIALDHSSQPLFTGKTVAKKVRVKNTSARYKLEGNLELDISGKTDGTHMATNRKQVLLEPGASLEFPLSFPSREQSSKVRYTLVLRQPPDTLVAFEELPYILTPMPPREPRINGPSRYGQRPGRPFLYTVPATGERPMVFKIEGLPRGLTLEPLTGIIRGAVETPGTFALQVSARNRHGSASRALHLVIGDTIALTPPLGWNSWNVWGLSVDQNKVLASARVFREKGLQNHGWSYINIDDGWEIKGDDPRAKRAADGTIIVNEKFPDMKMLGDSIHALGLKLGIYSSPGLLTCGGYTASYGYEEQDARSYASWGIDYLKYDWCSYDRIAKDTTRQELQKPYRVMRRALDGIGRDILFSLCQYGMGNVWEWGADVGGNCWRTTGDITDTWESMRDIGFSQTADARFAGPGRWNDPDMLVVGWVGWGPSLHPTNLTPDEQYTHISLWSLLASPLLIGCDLERLDAFTLNLLTNDEVLAINQDALGRQATPVARKDNIQVWMKGLEDGARAVGVFNLGETSQHYRLVFAQLGAPESALRVRDVWRQKNLGMVVNGTDLVVPGHGVVLLRVSDSK